MIYPTIIGVTGKKFHGKDTVSDYLVSNHGYTKVSFAAPLKEMCATLFNFTHEQVYGDLKEDIDVNWETTPRHVMQFVGTELFRDNISKLLPDVGENFWVKCGISKIKSILTLNPDARIVISDIRFPNEIEFLKNFDINGHKIDFISIKVIRSSIIDNDTSVHASERMIDMLPVNIEIFNDGTLDDLYVKILDILSNYTPLK